MGEGQAEKTTEGAGRAGRRGAAWVRRRMGVWLLTLAGIYAAYLLVGCAIQRSMVFPRDLIEPVVGVEEAGSQVARVGGEQWWLETDAGRVEAWFLPGEGVSAASPGPAALFAHGNAEVIDRLPGQFEAMRRLGVSVLLIEYRGYGRSAGKPSERALVADAVAWFDRLAAREEVDAGRMVLHGRSVGTGVVCGVARRRTPAVMMLESPFTSIASIAARFGLPRFMVMDPFDNAAVLREAGWPVLIQHGRGDTAIAYSHSEKLHDLTPHSTLIGYESGHNDMPIFSAAFRADVERFLVTHGVVGAGAAELGE